MSALVPILLAYISSHLGVFVGLAAVSAFLLLWLIWALRQHPIGFWFIFWGELAERSSFYGMRTILALYLINVLHFAQNTGASVMQGFMAICYAAPLLGGFLADRVLGRYKTILYFSGPYILGHLILGGFENRTALFIALGLLALGSGSIKPNTSTLMGAMYEAQKKEALLTKAFSYYYAAINVGSFISTFSLPLIRNTLHDVDVAHGVPDAAAWSHGYSVALMIPAALMAAAFFFFALGKRHYPQEQVRGLPPKTPEQRSAERATLGRIMGLFLTIAVFWFVYDESASTWIYFAQDHMNLTVFSHFPGIGTVTTTPDQIQSLNPLLIIILTPIFNLLWDVMKSVRGSDVPDTFKMLIGFVIVIACMATMSVAGYMAAGEKVSVWWMIIATFVITLSELCVSVVGLEFAFKVAAPGTKSAVTAAFLFMVFVGDSFGTFFNGTFWGSVSPGTFFAIQTAIMIATLGAFVVIARKFERSGNSDHGGPQVAAA